MANKKITDATTATSVAGTDKVFLNQGGDLKQVDLNSAVANSQAVQTLNSNLGNSMNIIISSTAISKMFQSMPDSSFKIFMIQNSPDNPFITGNICFCHIYKINSSWGTIVAISREGNKKRKNVSNGSFSEWL